MNSQNRNLTIASRFREVFLDGYFIANTNYKQSLEDVSIEQATAKVGDLNTIAALTYHINYYLSGILSAFETDKLEIRDEYSFDLPPLRTEQEWKRLVAELIGNAERFANYVEEMEEGLFDRIFIKEKYGTFLRNIEGVIEHGYYHLGQISLIKKIITNRNTV